MSPCSGVTFSALPLPSLNVRTFCAWSTTRTCVPRASVKTSWYIGEAATPFDCHLTAPLPENTVSEA